MKEALAVSKPTTSNNSKPAPSVPAPVNTSSNQESQPANKQRVVIRKNPTTASNQSNVSNLTTSLSSAPASSGSGLKAPTQRSKLMLSTAPVSGSTGTSSGLVSSARDDEFDFDAPPVIEQKKEEVKTEAPSVLKPKAASNLNSKNYANPENYADRFKSAKSISSDQYFGRESNEEDVVSEQIRKEKFSGSRAISSDDYFGRRPSAESPRNSPTVDLSQLGAAVLQQGAKFANSLLSGRR
jgi:hypothetical protein